ncbi:hypothetical protein A2U01_0001985 [Trifolium medium]|uniref:Uncharacterized protein n=1 Tax=Trifolium medium TaxID=97028 RepID=A0A392M1P9_9FABA|nr:hypothetical protein [Trifolium medium]
MSQLADRVRQLERLRAEKVRNTNFKKKKEVNFIEPYDSDFDNESEYSDYDESEINVAELKPGPPYTCKLLRPSNGKNPVEPKNDRFVAKTYTFDITKCDEIFDLLVSDGQIIVPKDLKIPPIDQRKKRGYCKYHNYLGHKTYQCVLFRDLVQKALNEGRLKFADKAKPQMKVDTDPLPKTADSNYVEILHCNMVDMVDPAPIKSIPEPEYEKKIQEVYPKAEEELVDFLNRCKLNNSEVMLCPRCSAVCDKEATAGLRNFIPHADNKRKWPKPNQNRWPYKQIDWSRSAANASSIHQRLGPQRTFKPSSKAPTNQWVSGQYVAINNRKMMEKGSSSSVNVKIVSEGKELKALAEPKEMVAVPETNKYGYRNNYKGKNPMTRTQWRRYQRKKKLTAQGAQAGGSLVKVGGNPIKAGGNSVVESKKELARRPLKERLAPIAENVEAEKEEADMEGELEGDFMEDDPLKDEPDFDVLVNVISVLPADYDVQTEVNEGEEEQNSIEMANNKPVCYYIIGNGCVEDQNGMFERPDPGMKNHLKALFVRAKVNGVGVNRILVDGGAVVNILPQHMLKRLGVYETDLRTHNVVLANFEGNISHALGAIQLEVCVGTTVRKTLFMVIAAKPNYNMLLGREWIHGTGAVPSTMHQRLIIWREDGLVEYVEADQSAYVTETNTVTLQNFDKNLASIAPCGEQDAAYDTDKVETDNVLHSIKLHPTHGFCWEREEVDKPLSEDGNLPATGWGDETSQDD